jgi:hypothetical protein
MRKRARSEAAGKRATEYRCEASSVEGFIQQLAVSYVKNGYFFYVSGAIPEGKEPRETDAKILGQYDIAVSKFTRARRKKAGSANLHYLRHGRFFVILATLGRHRFFEDEGERVRDVREAPIRYEGYSVSFRAGHPCVRIDRGTFLNLKAYFEDIATKRKAETIAKQLHGLPFRPFGPVVSQLFIILRAVNRARQVAGFEPVPKTAIRVWRQPVKTFEPKAKGVNVDVPAL